jgi:hypothetical protein
MLFLCRNIGHPAIGAGEMFGRPDAIRHAANMRREPIIFQPVRPSQWNAIHGCR